jgi:hypothetical protein
VTKIGLGQMDSCKVFVSYSHADEWLKDELLTHLSALKRNGMVDVWHDRCIPPGGMLHDEISDHISSSDIFLFLVSPNFIASDYCIKKEYEAALHRRALGEAEIVPIIVRSCDWDVGGLRAFSALPPDAVPVTKGAGSRADVQERDSAWLKVIEGIKFVIAGLKKKREAPKLNDDYHSSLFKVDFIRHPSLEVFDESLVLIDPDVYFENEKQQVSTFEQLFDLCSVHKASIITGSDRSGKTVIAKQLQVLFADAGLPAILINGSKIKNKDVYRIIDTAKQQQFALSNFPSQKFRVIVDDFDECNLPDNIKESAIKAICESFEACIVVSFSNAPSVLFTSNELPDPAIFRINPINDAKLFNLVRKWVSVGLPEDQQVPDATILTIYEKLQLVFGQTEIEKAPYSAVTFLELLQSISATDIAFSSYAACYDSLINNRLGKADVNWGLFDESKNFLSLVAYRAYSESSNGFISHKSFEDCIATFEERFLSSAQALRRMALGHFLREDEKGYCFYEDYLWFFLCARYVVNTLKTDDQHKYREFIGHCTSNIFQKKFANIVIYIAYFSNDNFILESLLSTLDGLFSKADNWIISDDTRELMISLASRDALQIKSKSDVSENRLTLLQEKIADIVNDAERVVARYTLPFLNSNIADSYYVEGLDSNQLDGDSYMRSVNALLRTHSVIGQILSGRSGTFSANIILDCITRMVKASGRYVSLNHAIATVLIYDKDKSIVDIDQVIKGDKLTEEEKYEKFTRIFAFWSVYISHAGLARYLTQHHSIRALQRLAEKFENESFKTERGNIPFNFTLVMLVARLYHTGKIDRDEIETCVEKYGEHSSLMALLRVVMHIYAYYMPLSIEDKQWISNKLQMPLKRIELQRMKAGDVMLRKRLVKL